MSSENLTPLLQDSETGRRYSFLNDIHPHLIFLRVLKVVGGYPVEVEGNYDEHSIWQGAWITIDPNKAEEIAELEKKVRLTTRGGDIMFQTGDGNISYLEWIINHGQHYSLERDAQMNLTPRVANRVLYEAFVFAYEKSDGYRQFGSNRPELDTLYEKLTSRGIQPLTPEGMGYVFAKSVQYVNRQSRRNSR